MILLSFLISDWVAYLNCFSLSGFELILYNLSNAERASRQIRQVRCNSPLIQFKELLKVKKEQEDKLKTSANPFLSVSKKADYSMYNQLYKFDVKQELQDYNLPFAHPEDLPPISNIKPLAASKVSSLYEASEISQE